MTTRTTARDAARGIEETMAETNAAESAESMSLEAILDRMGSVVEKLEKGDLPLEDALRYFEHGVRLSREGHRRLDAAERRIEALLSNEPGAGEPPLGPAPSART